MEQIEDLTVFVTNPATQWTEHGQELFVRAEGITHIADDDNATFEVATKIITECKKHLKVLEDERKAITRQIDSIKKNIMQQERDYGASLSGEVERLSGLCNDYIIRQRQREEAARRAQAEAEAEQAEIQEAADEFGVKIELPEIKREEVAEVKTNNAAVATHYNIEIVDVQAVPRDFCSPDLQLIRRWLAYQRSLGKRPEDIKIPGVKITLEYRINQKRNS